MAFGTGVVVVVVVGVPTAGWSPAGWTSGALVTVGVFTAPIGLASDVVEDVAHQRRRGLGAVPALVDDGQHHVLRVGVGPEGHEPAVGLLPRRVGGRPRLAGQVPTGREALEVGVGGARPADMAMTPSRPCRIGSEMLGGQVHVARHLGGELLHHLARGGVDDLGRHLGRIAGATVGEGGIGHRLLNGRERRGTLPEGHLDVVTRVPRGVRESAVGFLVVQLLALGLAVDAALSTSLGRSMPVLCPSPYCAATF